MKKLLLLVITTPILFGCRYKGIPVPDPEFNDYGAFLGRSDNDVSHFSDYKYVSLELDEFGDSNINRLINKGVNFLAYLNVGSLENYRDYYDDYESNTFKDYENWSDERWIDVSNVSWQNFIINNLAKGFKDRNVFGVYMDNIDVYSIAKEDDLDYVAFGHGLKNIIKGVSDLGLKVMINGGSEFLEDLNEQDDDIFNSIWGYHQEEVFSLIIDYEHNSFGEQNKEDKEYYQQISTMMKEKGKEIFYLEYTSDDGLKQYIRDYCEAMQYHYYIANDVDLK